MLGGGGLGEVLQTIKLELLEPVLKLLDVVGIFDVRTELMALVPSVLATN